MRFLGALAAAIAVGLIALAALGVPAIKLRSGRRHSSGKVDLQTRLLQAGLRITPGRYRLVVTSATAGVAALLWLATGTLFVALPPAVIVPLALRSWLSRSRARQLALRATAWPEAIRDLIAHLQSRLTLQLALAELGRTGPESLRPVWRRFAANAETLGVATALEVARTELADPVSDRVIEVFRVFSTIGDNATVHAVLDDLVESTIADVRLTEGITTAQLETKLQAVIAGIAPFGMLVLLCSSNAQFREFYQSGTGVAVIIIGGLMSLGGWKLIEMLGRIPGEQRVLTGGRSGPSS